MPVPEPEISRVVGTEAEFSVTLAVPLAVPDNVETGEEPATPE